MDDYMDYVRSAAVVGGDDVVFVSFIAEVPVGFDRRELVRLAEEFVEGLIESSGRVYIEEAGHSGTQKSQW